MPPNRADTSNTATTRNNPRRSAFILTSRKPRKLQLYHTANWRLTLTNAVLYDANRPPLGHPNHAQHPAHDCDLCDRVGRVRAAKAARTGPQPGQAHGRV